MKITPKNACFLEKCHSSGLIVSNIIPQKRVSKDVWMLRGKHDVVILLRLSVKKKKKKDKKKEKKKVNP